MLHVLLLATSVNAAHGAEPQVEVADDGAVIARLKVDAGEQQVRATIPTLQATGVNSNVLSVSASPDGSCERVKLKVRGLFAPFEIETRRCPTTHGWKETLVASASFTEYWNEWTIQETEGGSTVTFKTKTIPNVVVPAAILQSETRRVVAKLMRNLSAAVIPG